MTIWNSLNKSKQEKWGWGVWIDGMRNKPCNMQKNETCNLMEVNLFFRIYITRCICF